MIFCPAAGIIPGKHDFMQRNVPIIWLFAFLIVFVLVIGLIRTLPKSPKQDQLDVSDNVKIEDVRIQTFQEMLDTGTDAVLIENQISNSREVFVGYVVLSAPGFVVVYDDNDGVPGKPIGDSGWLEQGGEHISFWIDEILQEGNVYYAVIYHDDGDKDFQEVQDKQATDSQGSVVLMTFEALSFAAPETLSIQP